jgi:hypothetical protein
MVGVFEFTAGVYGGNKIKNFAPIQKLQTFALYRHYSWAIFFSLLSGFQAMLLL